MKKTIVLIFVLLMSLCGFGQTSGKIIYQVNMDRFRESSEKNNSGNPSDELMSRTAELAENSTLEMLYQGPISLFKHQKSLEMDGDEFTAFAKVLVCKGDYYTDLKDHKRLFVTEFGGETMNVVGKVQTNDWKLTKETKEIGDFTCYKAILKKGVPGKEKEVVAWYTTDIPLSHGPLEYGGSLPGIILELDDMVASYMASEVIFKKNQKVTWPKNINTITQKEYDQKTKSAWRSIKE